MSENQSDSPQLHSRQLVPPGALFCPSRSLVLSCELRGPVFALEGYCFHQDVLDYLHISIFLLGAVCTFHFWGWVLMSGVCTGALLG